MVSTRTRLLLTLGILFAVAAPRVAAADAADELKKLQGKWKVLSFERAGQKRDAKEGDRLVVEGDVFRVYSGDTQHFAAKVKIDAAKKSIDMEMTEGNEKGKTALGLYKVEGKELKVCINAPGETDRPAEFAAKEGTKVMIVTLQKE